ncbi:type II secretion system secretin GspD [Desulfurobacterium atlanticum]|uniref:Type II secretion system protein D (GspD) n=1 Tax=Desulfurobacterium atlanticum TaxID=240169 RepID=A0A238ZBY2_9BACT|nr:type II secretion system secretin GspD [Desulfurobacterium atlanticum]SNR80592.1 type II secretion system protein D (GspD) [Desulfurobacterium atlanticum]
MKLDRGLVSLILAFSVCGSSAAAPFNFRRVDRPPRVREASAEKKEGNFAVENIDFNAIKRSGKLTLNFDNIDIATLTYMASQLAGKNIIVPDSLKGSVTLIFSEPVSIKDFWNIYTAILRTRGYAIVDKGKFYEVIPESKTRGETPPLEKKFLSGDVLVTYVYRFKNGNISNVEKVLAKMRSKRGHLLFYKPTNMVIITDTAANIKNFKEILSLIDSAEKGTDIKVYSLEYSSPTEVAAALKTVFSSFSKRGVPFVVYPATSSGSIAVMARKDLFPKIEEIIEKLDVPSSQEGEKKFYVIYLKNSKAKDLSAVLNKLVASIAVFSSSKKKKTVTRPGTKIKIVPDESINALIVYANEKEYKAINDLVSQLDRRRKQVLVSVFITEVSQKALKEIGIRWQAFGKNGGATFRGGLSDADFFSSIGMSNFAAGFLSSSGQSVNIGGTNVFFPNLLMLFSLLESGTGFNVISAPKLLTINNKEAKIDVSQITPFAESLKFDVNGNPIINYSYKPVGLVLKITPHISVDKSIVMETHLEVNDIIGYEKPDIGGIQYVVPITSKRELDTTIKIPNGKTIVLGGLISKKTIKTMEGVPLLSSIPIVGNLFKYKSEDNQKTNLFIFMTPFVVETPEDIAKITEWHKKMSKLFIEKEKELRKRKTEDEWKSNIVNSPNYEGNKDEK